MLKVENVTKKYGDLVAVNDLSFEVKDGEILGIDDFDISDDELLAHLCIKAGIFSYRDWQELINTALERIRNINYEVDSSKRRLSLEETVYQMGGFCGKVSADGYKMLSALCARELVFKHVDSFSEIFGSQPRNYIEKVWNELDSLLTSGFISGEYTFELHDLKYQK